MDNVYYLKTKKSQKVAEFRPAQNVIAVNGSEAEQENITLSHSETKVLELLIKDAGQTKSREELLNYAWDKRVVSSGSLNQCIFSIRNLLGDERDHEIIQTIPRRGYRFNIDHALSGSFASSVNSSIMSDHNVRMPEISAANSAALTEEEASMLQEIYGVQDVSGVDEGSDAPASLRSVLVVALGVGMLVILVLFNNYAGHMLKFLGAEVSFHTVYQHGVTINILDSKHGKDEVAEYVSQLPFPSSITGGEVWVYARQYDIGLSCINLAGKAINTIVSYQGDWRRNTLTALTGCLG